MVILANSGALAREKNTESKDEINYEDPNMSLYRGHRPTDATVDLAIPHHSRSGPSKLAPNDDENPRSPAQEDSHLDDKGNVQKSGKSSGP